jgi:hypothetical protein
VSLVSIRRKVQKRTENLSRWGRARLEAVRAGSFSAEDAPPRPTRRSECVDGERPCPWVSCRHHLAIDVQQSGSLTLYVPVDDDGEAALEGMTESCSLDVADRGEHTLEEIGEILGCTRENVRQRVDRALARFAARRALVARGEEP